MCKHRDTLTMTITATLAGAISMLGNFASSSAATASNNNPLGAIGVLLAMIVAPFAAMLVQMAISRTREYSADRARRRDLRQAAVAGLGAGARSQRSARRSRTQRPSATRRRRTCSSSTRCPAAAWTICSPPIPPPRTASRPSRRWRSEIGLLPSGTVGQRQPRYLRRQPGGSVPLAPMVPGRAGLRVETSKTVAPGAATLRSMHAVIIHAIRLRRLAHGTAARAVRRAEARDVAPPSPRPPGDKASCKASAARQVAITSLKPDPRSRPGLRKMPSRPRLPHAEEKTLEPRDRALGSALS